MPGHMRISDTVEIGFDTDGVPYAKRVDQPTPPGAAGNTAPSQVNGQVHEKMRQLNEQRNFILLWWDKCDKHEML